MTLDPQTFLHGSPDDIRLRLLRSLKEQFGGDMAFYGTLVAESHGWVMAGALPIGPPQFEAKWRTTNGLRLMDHGVDLEFYWDFNAFTRHDRSTEPGPVVDGWWKPFGITDVLGINVCRGPHYLGYIGLYRTTASPRFTDADVKRAAESARLVRHVLEAADALASKVEAPIGAHVFDPDGALLFTVNPASPAAEGTRALEEAARQFLTANGPGDVLVGRSLVSMSRLMGSAGPAALAIVRPVRESTVPDILRLTRLKRTIAIYAAAGATTAEIAATMDRKPETIRAHLKEIYLRLGIKSRVELAELVERARTNTPSK
jgi:DNA-binding CsgD family transcriptional regulator